MFIFIYIYFADAVKIFQYENFKIFFEFTFEIQAFFPSYSQGSGFFIQDTSKIGHFLPRYFQDQAFSSKLLPRSDIFLQDLPSYLQE